MEYTEAEAVPLVIGVSILDITMDMGENMPTTMDGAMYHGKSAQSAGGVGRNLAESIYKLYGRVHFISLIGQDMIGEILLKLMPEKLWPNIEREAKYRTSSCTVAIDKNGDCKLILGDMEIHEHFYRHYIIKSQELLNAAPLVIIDGNLPMNTIAYILQETKRLKVPVFYEPTDLRISGRPFRNIPPTLTQQIRLTTPNYDELKNIVDAVCGEFKPLVETPNFENTGSVIKSVKCMLKAIGHLFDCVVVTMGQHGVILCLNFNIDPYQQPLFRKRKYVVDKFEFVEKPKRMIFFPTPIVVENVVNVSGAGDSFAGGFISGLLKEHTVTQSIALGFMAARKALQTTSAVPHEYFLPGTDKSVHWKMKMEDLKKPGNANEKVLI